MRKQPLTALELFLLQLLVPLDPVTFTRNKILARLRLHYIGAGRNDRVIFAIIPLGDLRLLLFSSLVGLR